MIYKILGGETFLSPDLKSILMAVPQEICGKVSIFTNGMIVPDDMDLFAFMRRKGVNVILSSYGTARQTKKKLTAALDRVNISYETVKSPVWMDYGAAVNHGSNDKELLRQFMQCFINCKLLLNGCLYAMLMVVTLV